MQNPVAIENIEELRRQQGIDDIELRKGIRELEVGDSVRLTFMTGPGGNTGETLLVRITCIRGYSFRGKLCSKPSAASGLHVGSVVVFTTDHIHSLLKMQPPHEY